MTQELIPATDYNAYILKALQAWELLKNSSGDTGSPSRVQSRPWLQCSAYGKKPGQPCHTSSEGEAAGWGCNSQESKCQRTQVLVLTVC